ncbi:MAG: polysaccharide pyruvyl transferase CsaB [Lachnospirales bacterium]
MVKFLITGYYGFFNSGDDAILLSMCEDIESLSVATKTTILSNSAVSTKEKYSANAVYRFSPYYVIREILKCDILIMGGGSLLQDKTSTRSLMYYLSILLMAKFFRKKIMIYANGIGPIDGKLNRKITKFVLNKVDLITIREKLSIEELYSMGVKKDNIKLTADPVFNLNIKDTNIDDILQNENIDLSLDFVTILFREWNTKENYKEKMAKICDYIVKEKNMNVVFIPMKYPSDIKTGEEIASLMTEKSYVVKSNLNVYEIIKLIGMSKISLSMRLHALLYSALKNVPMIGFTYDPKVDFFLRELEIYSIVNMESFKWEEVAVILDRTLENYDDISIKIENRTKELSRQADLNKFYLEELIKRK